MGRIFCCFLLLITPLTAFADAGGEYEVFLDSLQETDEYWQAVSLSAATGELSLSCKSAVLMEAKTGKVLYEHNADASLPPASVTKIMTILLVAEAIDRGELSLTDTVTASTEASKMGGSQIYLKENEEMAVSDLLKATVVASANDAAYALAEAVSGSEAAFVAEMNKRAAELNMTGTLFANTTGLPKEGHYSTARDIALMSRELLKHEFIFEYTTIWLDYLRDGETQLVNTNKLIRRYKGATGLKTGSTEEAGCCISATARRDELELIAVVLGADSSAERFDDAKTLLDYGFLNFAAVKVALPDSLAPYSVKKGRQAQVAVTAGTIEPLILPRGSETEIKISLSEPTELTAPVKKGTAVGKITLTLEDAVLAEIPIVTAEEVKKLTWWYAFSKTVSAFFTL